MKVCTVCGESKDLSAFYKWKTSRDGYSYRCKGCDAEARRRSRNGEGGQGTRDGYRRRKLVNQYEMTPDHFEKMMEAQGGMCAICNTTNPNGEGVDGGKQLKTFAMDHDHSTGRIRELLCNLCNRALGFMRDNPQTLRAGALYLEKHGAGCH